MINKRFALLLLTALVLLAACRPALPGAEPIPLTGERASVLGAGALIIQGEEGARTFHLTPVLADTGQPVPGAAAIELGQNIQYGFSPNRELMGVLSYGAADCPEYCFRLIDLRTWKVTLPPVEIGKTLNIWAAKIVFDPPAARAAVILNKDPYRSSQVAVVELATGKVTHAGWDENVYRPELLFDIHFTPAGDLALYGATGQGSVVEDLRAVLLDATTLEITWQQELDGLRYGSEPTEPGYDPVMGRFYEPGAVFTADGSRLYLVAADKNELVTVDFTRRGVTTTAIRPPQSLLDRLMTLGAGTAQAKLLNGSLKTAVLSPDGERLYVVGQTMNSTRLENGQYTTEVIPHGLQVIDPATGTELAKVDTGASSMVLSPDGGALFLHSWPDAGPRTELFDPAAGQITGSLAGQVRVTRLLNGELAWVDSGLDSGASRRLNLYAPAGRAVRSYINVETGAYADWVVIP